MARGGARPNAGRKTNHEREVRRQREQAAENSVVIATAEDDAAYWKVIKEKALAGNREAMKIWADYRYGRPTQQKEQQSETEFNLTCNFRGNCWHCGMPYDAAKVEAAAVRGAE